MIKYVASPVVVSIKMNGIYFIKNKLTDKNFFSGLSF